MGPHLVGFEELLFLLIILPASIAVRPCCVIACHLPPSRLQRLESRQETLLLCEIRRRWSTNWSLLKATPKLWERGKGLKVKCFLFFPPTRWVWWVLKRHIRPIQAPGSAVILLGAQKSAWGVAAMCTWDKHATPGHRVMCYFNWKAPTSFPFSSAAV